MGLQRYRWHCVYLVFPLTAKGTPHGFTAVAQLGQFIFFWVGHRSLVSVRMAVESQMEIRLMSWASVPVVRLTQTATKGQWPELPVTGPAADISPG